MLTAERGGEVIFYFSFVTKWGSATYDASARQLVAELPSYDDLLDEHRTHWFNEWDETPLLLIPDPAHEELFYRSVYWLLSTAGSTRFLPGKGQFGNPCWNMRPFTYGAAGWSTLAFEYLGLFARAERMLHNFYAPGALRENAALYIADRAARGEAFSFAHEIRTNGTTTNVDDEQRHVNGFALAMFHRYYQLHPDEGFLEDYLYPVAKGVAEFWTGLAIYDRRLHAYRFPVLRSVSEDLSKESTLDVVLSAKWSLTIASQYAEQRHLDLGRRARRAMLAGDIYVPQNERVYLEYLGDDGARKGGGYQGVRAPVYLGYPTSEVAGMVDREKAIRTIEQTWQRNNRGENMLGFVGNWFSIAAAHLGQGDLALEMANRVFDCYSRDKVCVCEGPQNLSRAYFETTIASYIIVPISMVLQSDEDGIRPFPAIPSGWKDISFYNLPAAGAIRVSGSISSGAIEFIKYKLGANELLTKSKEMTVRAVSGQLRFVK